MQMMDLGLLALQVSGSGWFHPMLVSEAHRRGGSTVSLARGPMVVGWNQVTLGPELVQEIPVKEELCLPPLT